MAQADKPKRTRRTRAQIEADNARAAAQKAGSNAAAVADTSAVVEADFVLLNFTEEADAMTLSRTFRALGLVHRITVDGAADRPYRVTLG